MENHIFLVKGEMGEYLNVSKSANWKKDIYHWIQILYMKCVTMNGINNIINDNV